MSDVSLQLELTGAASVAPGAPIIFDAPLVTPPEIDYDDTTGSFTINQPGRYFFNWWVATQSSTGPAGMTFELVPNAGAAVQSASAVRVGQVSGAGVVEVTVAPVEVALLNATAGTVYFPSSVQTQAGIVVNGFLDDTFVRAYGSIMNDEVSINLTSTPQTVSLGTPSEATENVDLTTEDTITIEVDGVYRVDVFVAGTLPGAASPQNVTVSVYNGVAQTSMLQTLQASSDAGTVTFTMTNYLNLTAGDTLTLAMETAPDLEFFFSVAGNGAFLSVQRVG